MSTWVWVTVMVSTDVRVVVAADSPSSFGAAMAMSGSARRSGGTEGLKRILRMGGRCQVGVDVGGRDR